MAAVVKAFQKLTGVSSTPNLQRKTRFDFSRFAEGDRVFIKGKRPKFSKPLQKGGKLGVQDGFISHDEIIGATPSQTLKSNRGKPYRVTFPDLDTYISSMPRKVTPVYGTYANYIVSLFDIHVAPPTAADSSQQPLEILDTGTGHGAVTLHLARAIQAANPPIPELDVEGSDCPSENISDDSSESGISADENNAQVWKDWRASRCAVVHSVEISPTYSKHAEKKVVAGFRRGLYSPHIDFHVANVNDWIDRQLEERDHESFLGYVFLDMASCHQYMGKIATAMKEDALIAVFVPSITQIAECVREVKAKGLLLRMEKVLELGDGISNGRLWDVRLAFKKASDPIDESNPTGRRDSCENGSNQEKADPDDDIAPTSAKEGEDKGLSSTGAGSQDGIGSEAPVMVCRPKVGERVIGGGFVALWRRKAL